jgi:hypothetical protein
VKRPWWLVAPLLMAPGVAWSTHSFEAGNDQYRVSITRHLGDDRVHETGFYTAMCGRGHPLWPEYLHHVELLRAVKDCARCTGDSSNNFWVVRSYELGADYTLGAQPLFPGAYFQQREPGYTCVNASDLSTPLIEEIVEAGRAVGLRATWLVGGAGNELLIQERLRVHGEDFVGSSVEVTLSVTNLADEVARLGLRAVWQLLIDGREPAIGLPELPAKIFYFGTRPPDPPLEPFADTEVEVDAPAFRMWQIYARQHPSTTPYRHAVACAVAGPTVSLDPPPTPPDIIQFADLDPDAPLSAGGGAYARCFEWHVPDPPRSVTRTNLLGAISYWGPDEERAIVLPPGAEVRVTQYLVAFEHYPLRSLTGGPYEADCAGPVTGVPLNGRPFTLHPTTAPAHYRWTSPAPEVTFSDPTSATSEARVAGVGTFPVTLTIAIGAYEASAETTVTVTDTNAPEWLDVRTDPVVLWPPDHRLVDVHVDATVVDDCDPAPVVRLIAAESSEADDELGSGHTEPDIVGAEVGTPDLDVLLRSERSGRNAGRRYTLRYEAVDWAGNASQHVVRLRVPHDLRRSEPLRIPARDPSGGRR